MPLTPAVIDQSTVKVVTKEGVDYVEYEQTNPQLTKHSLTKAEVQERIVFIQTNLARFQSLLAAFPA